jgi:Fur family ferric uptake transcriptional regulator
MLATAPGYISAQTLHDQLRRTGERIALTTVYRALYRYARAGHIDATFDDAGEHLFRAGPGPYLRCRSCGRGVPVDADTVTEWAETQAADHGFTEIHTFIDLQGRCPDCTAEDPQVERR